MWLIFAIEHIPYITDISFGYQHHNTTRKVMFVKHNTEAPVCNRFCFGKAMSIIQTVCAFVALGIKHAMRMRHIIMWPVPFYKSFRRY